MVWVQKWALAALAVWVLRLFLSSLVLGHVTSSSVVLVYLFLLGGIVVDFSIIVLVPSGEAVVSACWIASC
jgi:hypothetical protein